MSDTGLVLASEDLSFINRVGDLVNGGYVVR
jgi:hypothetical protein